MGELENILATYGWTAIIISAIIIFVVGTLKFFKVFDKVSKDWKKFIFYILDYALSFGLVAAYYGIFKIPFTNYVWLSLGTGSATIIVYALYENAGFRKLLQIFGNFVVSKVANNQVKEAVKNIQATIPTDTNNTTNK